MADFTYIFAIGLMLLTFIALGVWIYRQSNVVPTPQTPAQVNNVLNTENTSTITSLSGGGYQVVVTIVPKVGVTKMYIVGKISGTPYIDDTFTTTAKNTLTPDGRTVIIAPYDDSFTFYLQNPQQPLAFDVYLV